MQCESFSAIQDEAKLSLANDDDEYVDIHDEDDNGDAKSSIASFSLNNGNTKPFEKHPKKSRIVNMQQSHLLKMISAEGTIDHSH